MSLSAYFPQCLVLQSQCLSCELFLWLSCWVYFTPSNFCVISGENSKCLKKSWRYILKVKTCLNIKKKFTAIVKKGKKEDFSDDVSGMVVGASMEYFTNCWSTGTLAQTSLGFTENGTKKRKYPVSGSCVKEKSCQSCQGSEVRMFLLLKPWSSVCIYTYVPSASKVVGK